MMLKTKIFSFFYDTNVWKHFFLLIVFSNFILFLDSNLVLTFSLFLIFFYIFLKSYALILNYYTSIIESKKNKFKTVLLSINKNYTLTKKINLTLSKFPNYLTSLLSIWFFNSINLKFNKPPTHNNYSILFSTHFIRLLSKKYNNSFSLDFNNKIKTVNFIKKTL